MENMTNPTMSREQLSLRQGNGIAMPACTQRGLAFGRTRTSVAIADHSVITMTTIARSPKVAVAKGHVAFVAYVPGILAWSPPIC